MAGSRLSPGAGTGFLSPKRSGLRLVQAQIVEGATSVTTGDGNGNWRFFVPEDMDGLALESVNAACVSAGTTGTMDIQVANVTQSADMLSTKVTIDTGEKTSYTAATPPVVNDSNAGISKGDEIRVDVDAVHSGTAAKGLIVILGFK